MEEGTGDKVTRVNSVGRKREGWGAKSARKGRENDWQGWGCRV